MNQILGRHNIVLDPVLPVPVIVLLGAALVLFTIRIYWRVGAPAGRWRSFALLLFRMAGIGLVVVLLLQPSRQEFLPPPTTERFTLLGVDTSLSMKQRDVESQMRLDAAKNLLADASVVTRNGLLENPHVRLFEFSDDARPVEKSVLDLAPKGKSTRLNKSVLTMLSTLAAGDSANALILLTDGHDLELVNPVKTGAAAHARQVPIYAVPFGKQGKVRDVSVHIVSFQPYTYVKQKVRISATMRLIGCEFEDISVQLLRHGEVVQTRRVNADEFQELPVEFEVAEPETGQYEYEVRVQPLEGEAETANNSAITYLNVIDQQIRVLMVEGDPYWDTTFLQRSLMRNDKFEVDALVRYGKDRVRTIRKTPGNGELRAPETLDQFNAYDIVILGRSADRIFDPAQITLLNQYVADRSGVVIFSRGRAFENSIAGGELEPVLWSDAARERVHLDVTAEGRSTSALQALQGGAGGTEALPDLIAGRNATQSKPLTATLAVAASREDPAQDPAVVHRRFGRGQVVSVGVEGLWRWGLNSKVEGANTPFDRFWDQMILWLMAGRDFVPTHQFSFRPNSANILLGEKVYFRLVMRKPDPKVASVPLTIYNGDTETGRANMTPSGGDPGRLTAEFLPEKMERYRAVANFPDGTTQESRFIVFTENIEEIEVATDTGYLRRLCESSGGRVIDPADLAKLFKELNSEKVEVAPKTRLHPLWNEAWVFYLAGVCFGLDWFLRRRWGLC